MNATLIARTLDGNEFELHVHERESGPTVQIGRGFWEYRVRDLCRHPLSPGAELCVDGGRGTKLDAPSTGLVQQLAREASGRSVETLDELARLWAEAEQLNAAIHDEAPSRGAAESDPRWRRFRDLTDRIDSLYDEGHA